MQNEREVALLRHRASPHHCVEGNVTAAATFARALVGRIDPSERPVCWRPRVVACALGIHRARGPSVVEERPKIPVEVVKELVDIENVVGRDPRCVVEPRQFFGREVGQLQARDD
jgi:hypothetical protein